MASQGESFAPEPTPMGGQEAAVAAVPVESAVTHTDVSPMESTIIGAGGIDAMGMFKGGFVTDAKELTTKMQRVKTGTFSTNTTWGTVLDRFRVNPWDVNFVGENIKLWADLHAMYAGSFVCDVGIQASSIIFGKIIVAYLPFGAQNPSSSVLTLQYLKKFRHFEIDTQVGGRARLEIWPTTDRLDFIQRHPGEELPYMGEIIVMAATQIGNTFGTDIQLPYWFEVRMGDNSYFALPWNMNAALLEEGGGEQPPPVGDDFPSIAMNASVYGDGTRYRKSLRLDFEGAEGQRPRINGLTQVIEDSDGWSIRNGFWGASFTKDGVALEAGKDHEVCDRFYVANGNYEVREGAWFGDLTTEANEIPVMTQTNTQERWCCTKFFEGDDVISYVTGTAGVRHNMRTEVIESFEETMSQELIDAYNDFSTSRHPFFAITTADHHEESRPAFYKFSHTEHEYSAKASAPTFEPALYKIRLFMEPVRVSETGSGRPSEAYRLGMFDDYDISEGSQFVDNSSYIISASSLGYEPDNLNIFPEHAGYMDMVMPLPLVCDGAIASESINPNGYTSVTFGDPGVFVPGVTTNVTNQGGQTFPMPTQFIELYDRCKAALPTEDSSASIVVSNPSGTILMYLMFNKYGFWTSTSDDYWILSGVNWGTVKQQVTLNADQLWPIIPSNPGATVFLPRLSASYRIIKHNGKTRLGVYGSPTFNNGLKLNLLELPADLFLPLSKSCYEMIPPFSTDLLNYSQLLATNKSRSKKRRAIKLENTKDAEVCAGGAGAIAGAILGGGIIGDLLGFGKDKNMANQQLKLMQEQFGHNKALMSHGGEITRENMRAAAQHARGLNLQQHRHNLGAMSRSNQLQLQSAGALAGVQANSFAHVA